MKQIFILLFAGLLFGCAQNDASAASAWGSLAKADISSVCEHIESLHPGMKDPQTPEFAGVVENACAAASAGAPKVKSYFAWRETMQSLITSFRDGHLAIRFTLEPTRVRWPGFLINGRNDGFVARYPAGLPIAENAPPEGARLLSCDGMETEALLKARLDGRSADLSKVPERLRQAWRLLLDMSTTGAPPFKQCAFETPTGEETVALDWTIVDYAQLKSALGPFTRRMLRGITMEWLADGAAWITLGDVQDEGRLKRVEAEMIAKQAKLRAAPYIVFDLRGSRGGNSMWGDRFASILWGADAVEARRIASLSHDPREYGKYWRASKAAARAIRESGDEFAAEGPDMAEVAAFWRGLADKIEAKPDGDATLLKDECCDQAPGPAAGEPPAPAHTGKVFVLTDAGCFSSSVVVMNSLKRMGAIQVGEPSGQNEVYGETVGPFYLPSGLARYWVPVSVIRQPRRDLGGLPPDIAWPGAMDDDAGIRAWIAGLAAKPATSSD